MATTVTGKLNQAASIFQAGESTGFGVRVGVQYYDRETQQKEWTNYECAIFAKAQGQIDFYKSVLVEGAIVELSGESIKIKQFEGQNGLKITLELINAKLGYAHNPDSQPTYGQNAQPQQQQGYNQPQQPQTGAQQMYGNNPQPQQQYQPPQQGGYNPGKQ